MLILLPLHSRLVKLPYLKSKNSLKIVSINNTLLFLTFVPVRNLHLPLHLITVCFLPVATMSLFLVLGIHHITDPDLPYFLFKPTHRTVFQHPPPCFSKPFHSPLSLFYMQRENVLQFVPGVCLWETYRCPSCPATAHTTIYTARLCGTPCNVSYIWRTSPVKYCMKLQRSGVCSSK
jgi:hypothetical protein